MRVRIEIEGHQTFRAVEGKVLYWGSTVERFNEDKDCFMVPCAVVQQDNNEIEVVAMKSDRTWVRTVALPEHAA